MFTADAAINIVSAIVLGILGVLLTIIGWLVADRLKSIQEDGAHTKSKVSELTENLLTVSTSQVKTEASIEHLASREEEFVKRLSAVEQTVNNTERIAVMSKTLTTVEEELKGVRERVHHISDKQHELELKFEVYVPKQQT